MQPKTARFLARQAALPCLVAALAPAAHAVDLAAVRAMSARTQWAAAESLATAELAELARTPKPDSIRIAEAHYLVGLMHMRRSGYADGKALAEASSAAGIRARAFGAQHPSVAEAELLLGRSLSGAGKIDSALVVLKRVIDVRTSSLAPADTGIAEAWDAYALTLRDKREHRAAIEAWDRAIAARTLGDGADSPVVAVMKANAAASRMELGDLAGARADLEAALAIFTRMGDNDHPSRWVPLNIMADVERRSGNATRNIDLIQESLRVVTLNFGAESRQAYSLLVSLANVLSSFNDFAGARAIARELLPKLIAQYGPTHWRTSQIRLGLAIAESKLDRSTAIAQFAELESLLVAAGPGSRETLGVVQAQYAELLMTAGRPRESLLVCDRAESTATGGNSYATENFVTSYLLRVRALIALGDMERLARNRERMDSFVAQYGPYPTWTPSDLPYFASVADLALGRDSLAWSEALDAEAVARVNNRLNLRRLSDARGFQYARATDQNVDHLLRLAAGKPERAEAAWDRLVRSRGLIRTELAQRALPEGLERDTTITGAHARWRTAQERYARLLVRGAHGEAGTRALQASALEAESAERAYAKALASRDAGGAPADFGLADVLAQLRPGQALVAFRESYSRDSPHTLWAFTARAGASGVHQYDLGAPEEIDAVVAPWTGALGKPPGQDVRALEATARKLGETVHARLWSKLERDLKGAAEVFVVADGSVLDLPWAALPKPGGKYWIETGPLVHPLDSEVALLAPQEPAATGRLVALGAPTFDHAPAAPDSIVQLASLVRAAPDPCANGRSLALPSLPGSGAEVTAVADAWQARGAGEATLLTAQAASEANLKRAAAGALVLHIATHGVMTGDLCAPPSPGTRGVGGVSPAQSTPHAPKAAAMPPPAPTPWIARRVWLALAGAGLSDPRGADGNDGILTAEEAATLELRGTDWVVLSACHSGGGEPWSNAGRLGMRRAFAIAGARSVIASGWALDDDATAEWMKELYAARLTQGEGAAAAIGSASRTILARRRASHRATHPFYWAGFTSSGR